jgi:hypothetical protein
VRVPVRQKPCRLHETRAWTQRGSRVVRSIREWNTRTHVYCQYSELPSPVPPWPQAQFPYPRRMENDVCLRQHRQRKEYDPPSPRSYRRLDIVVDSLIRVGWLTIIVLAKVPHQSHGNIQRGFKFYDDSNLSLTPSMSTSSEQSINAGLLELHDPEATRNMGQSLVASIGFGKVSRDKPRLSFQKRLTGPG